MIEDVEGLLYMGQEEREGKKQKALCKIITQTFLNVISSRWIMLECQCSGALLKAIVYCNQPNIFAFKFNRV